MKNEALLLFGAIIIFTGIYIVKNIDLYRNWRDQTSGLKKILFYQAFIFVIMFITAIIALINWGNS